MAKLIGKHSTLKLYKFIPFKYIKKIIQSGRMPIQRIDGWEDCYENYFLKNRFVIGIKQVDLKKISRKFYGLCFSRLSESDAMWRIYSDIKGVKSKKADALDNVAIRVCITPQQLYQMIPFKADIVGDCIIKRVIYKSKEKIETETVNANPYSREKLVTQITNSFFTKRKEFEHEKEVRYVFITKRYHKAKAIELSLNPIAFFDEFTIDPRLPRMHFCTIKRELEKLHIPSVKINQSDLYKYNQKTFVVIH